MNILNRMSRDSHRYKNKHSVLRMLEHRVQNSEFNSVQILELNENNFEKLNDDGQNSLMASRAVATPSIPSILLRLGGNAHAFTSGCHGRLIAAAPAHFL